MELFYTALTRQKEKIIIFLQGNRSIEEIINISNSEIGKRLTNLFVLPEVQNIDEVYFDKNLIHQASDGKMLRSKSELIIYEKLISNGFEPMYELPLIINGERRLPDFTIKDIDAGITYYWEHWGMMHLENYRQRREEKIAWYKSNGIVPFVENNPGDNGILIESYDTPCEVDGKTMGAISSKEIDEIIKTIFK